MYPLHQAQEDLLARLRPLALDAAGHLRAMDSGRPETLPLSQAAASLRLWESVGTTHQKPPFGLTRTRVGNRPVEVREEVVLATPFCALRRFAKDVADPGPRVLVVAPLSGHFATRLRGTFELLLPGTTSTSPIGSTRARSPLPPAPSAWTTWWRRSSPGWRRWGRARICSRCRSRPWRRWPPPR
jgi:poly-beta-hydroxyalkanoate depolymerase